MPTDWADKVRAAITNLETKADRVLEPDQALAIIDDVVEGSVRVRAGKYNLKPDRRPRWFRRLQGWPLRSQCDGGIGACGCWRKFVDEGGSGDGGGYAIHRSLDRTGQPIVGI